MSRFFPTFSLFASVVLTFAQLAPHKSPLDPGAYDDSTHLYRNRTFAFTCKLPYGWVERAKTMNADSADPAKGSVLLAAFERPPEARADTPNPTILIAAEPVTSYPGLKTADDYYAPLKAVTTAKGFQPAGDPYDFSIGPRKLLRAEFLHKTDRSTLYQSTMVLVARGSVVSFTFLAASEDEVNQLISTLNFTSPAHP